MDKDSNKLLEDYFNDATSDERKKEIKDEISALEPNNPDRILFELGEEVAMKEKVSKLSSNIVEIAEGKKGSWLFKIAASIVLVLLSVFAIYQAIDGSKSNQELFAEYFQPYPDLISVRIIDSQEANWKKGLKSYQLGKYEESLEFFEGSIPSAEYQKDVTFYHAVSLLALQRIDEAVVLFQSIKESKYRPQVNWYLALAYLHNDEKNRAKEWLSKMRRDDFKWAEAQRLIDEIK